MPLPHSNPVQKTDMINAVKKRDRLRAKDPATMSPEGGLVVLRITLPHGRIPTAIKIFRNYVIHMTVRSL